MMKRDEMLKTFARQRKDEIVVAVYTAAQEITHIQPNDLNYTFVGAMGQGSSHALGLALGRPDKITPRDSCCLAPTSFRSVMRYSPGPSFARMAS